MPVLLCIDVSVCHCVLGVLLLRRYFETSRPDIDNITSIKEKVISAYVILKHCAAIDCCRRLDKDHTFESYFPPEWMKTLKARGAKSCCIANPVTAKAAPQIRPFCSQAVCITTPRRLSTLKSSLDVNITQECLAQTLLLFRDNDPNFERNVVVCQLGM